MMKKDMFLDVNMMNVDGGARVLILALVTTAINVERNGESWSQIRYLCDGLGMRRDERGRVSERVMVVEVRDGEKGWICCGE